MSTVTSRMRMFLLMLLLGFVVSVPANAGSAVVGSVAGSTNATIGGQPLVHNTTLFSGDSLQVRDGAAVVAIGNGNRMVFGRETVASFLRESDEVTVLLGQGNVSMYHVDGDVGLRVKVGELTVIPAAGFRTLGDVAMANGMVVVTTKEGLLRIESKGQAVEVAKGKTITLLPKTVRTAAGAGGAAPGAAKAPVDVMQIATLGAAGLGAVFGIAAFAKAGDASDNALTAVTTAQNAVTAANAAKASADAATAAATAAGAQATKICNAISASFPCIP